ncbi:MAG: hypothetical protein KGL39_17275 [Patescibacteria group bacterium]|nr:hypothetical protein [Patescibacteria group bacterium]
MPLPGIGVAPVSGALYNELASVTRRAFVPRLFVQIYYSSPSLFYMMGNAQRAAGGLNQVTIPMQGQSMVQGQWTGYGGGFNQPVITPGIQNGQWNLAYWVVPVPLPFGETIIQATDREISLLKARMNDVRAVTTQNMASKLYTNNSANPLMPNSFLDAFDNGSNFATYGGISRNAAGNSAFKGQYINANSQTGFATVATIGFTRATMATMLQYITNNAGGEAPTFCVMNPGDYATLNADFVGVENTYINPGATFTMDTSARSSFPNLNVSGIPIFSDYFCPKGSAFFPNVKYTSMYLSEDAAFDFSGFYSLVPLGQIGQQGVVVVGYNVITAKSVSGAWVYNIGAAAF